MLERTESDATGTLIGQSPAAGRPRRARVWALQIGVDEQGRIEAANLLVGKPLAGCDAKWSNELLDMTSI